jgi:hypothetical protein
MIYAEKVSYNYLEKRLGDLVDDGAVIISVSAHSIKIDQKTESTTDPYEPHEVFKIGEVTHYLVIYKEDKEEI